MLQLRRALIMAGDLDPATEPVPLIGLSEHADLINLVTYVCDLVRRAASSARCDPSGIARSARAIMNGLPALGQADRSGTGTGLVSR